MDKAPTAKAPLRMLMNILDPDVAENPAQLVVYRGMAKLPGTGAAPGKSRA